VINTNLINILSDLFVNLSAGWLGATVVIPLQRPRDESFDWMALIINFSFSILSLAVSYYLVKLV
jgi:hypothetical protein